MILYASCKRVNVIVISVRVSKGVRMKSSIGNQ